MTEKEAQANSVDVDLNDLANTYFAPSRAIAAFDWEHPSLGFGFVRARLSVLGQFDMGDEELHTQYITGRLMVPVNAFLFDLGGSLGLLGLLDDGDTANSFAADLKASWTLPSTFPSRIGLSGRYFSGDDGNMGAFLPVTTKTQGSVLGADPAGITIISLDYITRLHRTFALSLSSSYFLRNSEESFNAYPVSQLTEGGTRLGAEIFGQLFWNPISDLSVNLGAGVFLPSMGNVTPEHFRLWRLEFGFTLSVF
jgi:hypothetical protein